MYVNMMRNRDSICVDYVYGEPISFYMRTISIRVFFPVYCLKALMLSNIKVTEYKMRKIFLPHGFLSRLKYP